MATLLMIEFLLPGGTLVVLALLFSRRALPPMPRKLAALFSPWIKEASSDRTSRRLAGLPVLASVFRPQKG